MLVSRNAREVPIPHEAGEWLKLRPLSWKQLDDARKARQREAVKSSVEMTREMGPELMAQIRSARTDAPAETAPGDPLDAYDRATLLRLGIVGWSYEEPVSAEAIDDLDEETAEWAARELIRPTTRTEDERLSLFRRA